MQPQQPKELPMPVTDSHTAEVEIAGELLALDEFIAGVLRRAHQTAQRRSPGEHRTIFRVAHLFADDLERTDPGFDRLRFFEAVAEGLSHA
jgi:hypothetical protein